MHGASWGWSVDFGGWGSGWTVTEEGVGILGWPKLPCASPSQEGRTEEQGLEQLSSVGTDKGPQRRVGGGGKWCGRVK